jgi:hypothetical protein
MPKKIIEVPRYYDEDEGESYYVLPSGYRGRHILVNESPVDLRVTYIHDEQLRKIEGGHPCPLS